MIIIEQQGHHGNDVEGHEIQSAPVARHGGDSFLQGNHSGNTEWLHVCQAAAVAKIVQTLLFAFTIVMYQLLTTVNSNRVTG